MYMINNMYIYFQTTCIALIAIIVYLQVNVDQGKNADMVGFIFSERQ